MKIFGRTDDIPGLRAAWQVADDVGFDTLWNYDHLVAHDDVGNSVLVLDGWTTLAAMAERTHRIRIGCHVTGVGYRAPASLAKIAATVDHLSSGRLEFGIGAGHSAEEYSMFGVPLLDHRVGRLDEGLQVIKALWTSERATFAGKYYRLANGVSAPKPVQRPYPPVWIGAAGPLMLRIVARHADVWCPRGSAEGDAFSIAFDQVQRHCEESGRDPRSLRIAIQLKSSATDRAHVLRLIEHWRRRGVSEFIVPLPDTDPAHNIESLSAILPEVRG